jgi:hypothetical protein
MKHPAFETRIHSQLYIGLFILSGGAIPLCLTGYIQIPTIMLVLQGMLSGLLFCGLSVLLWYIVRFTKLTGHSIFQRLLNYTVLFLLILFVWLGTDSLLQRMLFPTIYVKALNGLIPFKLIIGTFALMIVLQFYARQSLKYDEEKEEEDEVSNQTNEPNPLHRAKQLEPSVTLNVPAGQNTLSEQEEKSAPSKTVGTVSVKSGSNITIIPVNELLYLQSEGDYVILYTGKNRYIKEITMKQMEQTLPAYFIRVHRSSIINTTQLSRVELFEKNRYLLTLKGDHKVRASQTGYKALKEALNL